MADEERPLLAGSQFSRPPPGLSLFFATFCIVDLFGVFPIVALSRAIVNCGWIGIPLAFVVFAVQVYTAVLLGRCWIIAEHLEPDIINKSRYAYAAVAELSFGSKVSKFVSVLLDVTVFGAGVPNLLVASQNLQLVGLKTSSWEFNFSYCYWLVILGICLCPIMWLGSPKDMKWLTALSVVIVMSVAVLTWSCMAFDDTIAIPAPLPSPSWETVGIAYGILAFQFDIHPMILTVQVDMERKDKLGYAIVGGFLVTGSLFLVTTLLVYGWYGPAIRNNVLRGLPGSGPLYIDVLLVTLQICLSMVVGECAMFQDIEDKLRIPREFNWKRCALRSGLLMIAVLIGEVVPRFDLIMGLIGGALTGPLMFIMPPLMYCRLRHMQSRIVRDETVTSFRNGNVQPSAPTSPRYRQRIAAGTHFAGDPGHKTPFFLSANGRRVFGGESNEETWLSRVQKEVDDWLSLESVREEGSLSLLEIIFLGTIVAIGVLATIMSTFYSVRDTIKYAQFTPPCIS